MHLFFDAKMTQNGGVLDAVESQHCIRTLRHKVRDQILVANGQGDHALVRVTEANPKACAYQFLEMHSQGSKPKPEIHLIIAPTKNMDRMEWMVEKCCEIGVNHIHFIVSKNSERKVLKLERLQKKAISALKQSYNHYLTHIHELVKFNEFISSQKSIENAFVAHVNPDLPHLMTKLNQAMESIHILIGPEGDFTDLELKKAQDAGFIPVSLGNAVLRTETAGLLASHIAVLSNISA